jgi:DNA-3-methyladenine glycosylase I
LSAEGLALDDRGVARCGWAASTDDYMAYHDDEWGVVVHGETRLYERMTLEAFQSGLSWLTILRKREGFRAAFAGFDADTVATFGEPDVERLMADTAAITNAQAVVCLRGNGGLDELFWSFAPAVRRRPRTPADIPATTAESITLAKTLKRNGFAFVGPTTMYAAMQACGLVDDHLVGCHRGGG